MEDDHRGGRDRARIGAIGRTAQPEEQRGRRGEESRKQGQSEGEKGKKALDIIRPIAAVGNAGF